MSLYTDDSSLVQATVPAQTDDKDPLQALSKALTQPAESIAQAQALAVAIERFEAEPARIPEIAAQLLPMVVEGGDSLLRTWTLDLVLLAVGRADLRFEVKVAMAQTSLPALVQLLHPPVPNAKSARQLIPIFSTIYPLLFRAWATTRTQPDPQIVQALQLAKRTILAIVQAPKGAGVPRGVMAVAWKFVQRILLIGTRNGGADPRLQNKADPNVNLWPASNTTLKPAELEQEATMLRETLVTSLFTYDDPALLHPLFNMIPPLAKARPSLAPLLVSSVTQWTPAALENANRPPSQIRAVEKTVKVVMVHLSRFAPLSAFASQLAEGIANQRKRVEIADASARRPQRSAVVPAVRKRELSPASANQHAETSAAGAKRMKMEDAPSSGVGSGVGKGVEFDVSEFAPEFVIDLVMRNFEALRPEVIERAFAHARTAIETNSPDAMPVLAASLGFAVPGAQAAFATFGADEGPDDMLMDGSGIAFPVKSDVKKEEPGEDEAMNPLDMDSDDDDDEEFGDLDLAAYADLTNAETTASAVAFADFKLPPPQPPAPEYRDQMVETAISRIWQSGADLAAGISSAPVESTNPGVTSAVKPRELWMLLVSRLATRGKSPRDGVEGMERLQQMTCDYIAADFVKRSKFASVWLNEEWFNSKMAGSQSTVYTTALDLILKAYVGQVDNKDKSLSGFLVGLPEIPPAVLAQLGSLCVDPDKMIIGFTTLRELIEARPPVRDESLKIVLTLTTHSDRRIRVAAINTCRRWVPDVEPMNKTVTDFAKALLARFINVKPAEPATKPEPVTKVEPVAKTEPGVESAGEAEAEAGEATEAKVPKPEIALGTDMSPYLPTDLIAPVPETVVQQHLELLFALCKRQPEFLHDIFNAYPTLEASIQEAIGTLLAPLITSMGSSHPKLLEILRHFPVGADKLALRILTVLTDTKRKPDSGLVTMVKELMVERELDPRFVIPILADLEKAEVLKQLPRLVSLLCGSNSERDLVRKVFSSVVTIPDAITLSSNQPRAAKKDMLTPADLLVLLLEEEKQIGIKATIEAIGICFSMTDIFKSEVLAVVMQRVVDLPELPVVFLRTVIQAVNTYRSLVGFVANTVLPRLIAKKVWLNDKLWGGFVLCAKLIAPASFGALLQLPKEQLKDLVSKQPGLKTGLRTFMASKPGMAKAQTLNEIFGEPEPVPAPAPAPPVAAQAAPPVLVE